MGGEVPGPCEPARVSAATEDHGENDRPAPNVSVTLVPDDSATGYRPTVRDGEWVRFVIRFEVLDADRFREMATTMVGVSRDEPGTVVYDWYFDEPAMTGTLYEAYASAAALGAHVSGAVFTELAPRYADAVRVVAVDAYGNADGLSRGDLLGAPTSWWGAPIAAVTDSG